jgi:hypothetical protein
LFSARALGALSVNTKAKALAIAKPANTRFMSFSLSGSSYFWQFVRFSLWNLE